jgi:hypothetical protein
MPTGEGSDFPVTRAEVNPPTRQDDEGGSYRKHDVIQKHAFDALAFELSPPGDQSVPKYGKDGCWRHAQIQERGHGECPLLCPHCQAVKRNPNDE